MFHHQVTQQCVRQTPDYSNPAALAALIDEAENEAARRCGASDILYETFRQESFADILAAAPAKDRAEVEVALRERGFDPDQEPYQAASGECSLTGIETDCCPCGRHE
jgi:hypothetical protein